MYEAHFGFRQPPFGLTPDTRFFFSQASHQEALNILLSRKFHPWEGGEGKVTGQYVVSLIELAKQVLTLGPGSRTSGRLAPATAGRPSGPPPPSAR